MKLGILLSGTGRTLENFINLIDKGQLDAKISVVISSRKNVRGVSIAKDAGLPVHVFGRMDHDKLFSLLREVNVDLVCLAGWLQHIYVPRSFENRIMNIHPSLLPSFGGRGMYGHYVHEAVLKRGCKVSGCTVHMVNNNYDAGPIILQQTVEVRDDDTVETLSDRVFRQELMLYPEAVRLYGEGRLKVVGGHVQVLPSEPKPRELHKAEELPKATTQTNVTTETAKGDNNHTH